MSWRDVLAFYPRTIQLATGWCHVGFRNSSKTHDRNIQFMNTIRQTPKKIAVVVPKYGMVGGCERFASEITERLARNENFEIHVFANRWVASSDRITFHKVPKVRF